MELYLLHEDRSGDGGRVGKEAEDVFRFDAAAFHGFEDALLIVDSPSLGLVFFGGRL